jgi:uncharacterized protein YggE
MTSAFMISAIFVGLGDEVAESQEEAPVITVQGKIGDRPFGGNILFKGEPRTISVVGTGKLSAAPDIAEISVGVVTSAPTAREALAANNEAMTALHDVLKERGVAPKDIQTTQLSVTPQYSQPQPQPLQPGQQPREFVPRIVGYQVTNMVQIVARDLTKLGTLLDSVVQAGANQMRGISFSIDKPEKLMDQARKSAIGDARRRAELLAGESGMVVGKPLSIREEGAGPPPPRPMMLGRRAAFAPEAAMPVSAGEQELSLSVHVVYELKSPK